MPEPPDSPTLPPVLRKRLAVSEQNVLRLAAGSDGVFAVYRALNLRSEEEARKLIDSTKAKAARILVDAGANTNGHGPTPAKCGCGTEFTPRTGDGGKCSACRAGAPPRAPRPKPAGAPKLKLPPLQPPQHARTHTRRARKAEQRQQTPPPRERIPLPAARDLEPKTEEPMPEPEMIVNERRKDRALAVLKERGPMRQSDLAKALGISPASMSQLKPFIRDAIEEGERVRQSPMLRLRGATETGESATETPAEPVSMEPSSADELADESIAQRNGEKGGEDPEISPEISPDKSAQMGASVDTSREEGRPGVPGHEESERPDVPGREPNGELSSARQLVEKLREAGALAEEVDVALPDVLLKARYLGALLKKIEGGDTSPELLDRFERLAGIAEL